MEPEDFRYERLTAVLLARQTKLRRLLEQTNETGKRDSYGRAPFLITGCERHRVEDELRTIEDALSATVP